LTRLGIAENLGAHPEFDAVSDRGTPKDDTIVLVFGTVDGGRGDDEITFTARGRPLPGSLGLGGLGADTLLGSFRDDRLFDSAFNGQPELYDNDADFIDARGGRDQLFSGGGADTLDGGSGRDFAVIDRSTMAEDFRFTPNSLIEPYVASDGTTLVQIEALELQSGNGNDIISYSGGFANLFGGGGDDTVTAGLVSGNGRAALFGNAGDDVLVGGTDSFADGGDGDDLIEVGSSGGAVGGAGNDTISVTQGNSGQPSDRSRVEGGLGADRVFGSGSRDTLFDNTSPALGSDAARDFLFGGFGDDTLTTSGGRDRLDGGQGFDRVTLSRRDLPTDFRFRLDGPEEISRATDGTRIVDVEAIRFFGGLGRDRVTAGGGDDTLEGFRGRDKLFGGGDVDRLDGGALADTIDGGTGNDRLAGGGGRDTFRWEQLVRGDIDLLLDFVSGEDRLEFRAAGLGNTVAAGPITAAQFANDGASGSAAQFVYDNASRTLLFDQDGAGPVAAIAIAVFSSAAPVASDIVVVA